MTWNEAAQTALRELGAVRGAKQEALLQRICSGEQGDREIETGQERFRIEMVKEIFHETLREN